MDENVKPMWTDHLSTPSPETKSLPTLKDIISKPEKKST